MLQYPRRSIRAALLSTAVTIAGSWAAHAAVPANTLYILDNNGAPGQNAVLGFHRNIDGSLTKLPGSPFLTGGTGFGTSGTTAATALILAPPGPFDGENFMAADPVGGILYVPNGGSDNISALRMAPDGALSPAQGSPFAITGNTPVTLGLQGSTLIIANNATDPNQLNTGVGPSYTTARIDLFGHVRQIASVPLAAGSVPTQATPDGVLPLVITNETGAGTHSEYFLDLFFGQLHLLQSQPGPILPGNTTPTGTLGIDIHPFAPYEYVALTGASELGVYSLGQSQGQFNETFVGSVATTNGTAASPTGTGAGPCWLHVSPDGKYAYTGNTGSRSISVFSLQNPAAPVVVQTVVVRDTNSPTFDFEFSPDGRFIYFIEGASALTGAAAGNQVHILSVSQTTGQLTEIPASPVVLPVTGRRVLGVEVF
jgi:DNA-binding beta-propeller fold protein YncE